MTQEEKQLLLKDLCSRLPYDTIVHISNPAYSASSDEKLTIWTIDNISFSGSVKPYLRPMSNMTKKEKADYHFYCETVWDSAEECYYHYDTFKSIDWLNAHHFDVRGLIEKGLALEAPKGMYKEK